MTPRTHRALASVAILSAALTSWGCSSSKPTRVDEARLGAPGVAAASPLPTTTTEGRDGVLLLGDSALYYMYKANRSDAATASSPARYRLNKYGRVYFRDEDLTSHWVTPPQTGIRVSAADAAEYAGIRGYRGIPEGRDLKGLADE